jgi:plasmid stability protein
MGMIEKIVFDDATMRALEKRALESGHSLDDEVAELVRLGLAVTEERSRLLERSRALRAALPPQRTDSLTLLREDRSR